ncbi:hypothetical protein HMPREF1237_0361 [Streptococcus pyogenes GA41394]|nr:hypothetical protein HMPREF1237_0361 [Streptococcus pyogenes GA41394]
MKTPEQILEATIHIGEHKVTKTFLAKSILGFIGGAIFVSFLYFKVYYHPQKSKTQ